MIGPTGGSCSSNSLHRQQRGGADRLRPALPGWQADLDLTGRGHGQPSRECPHEQSEADALVAARRTPRAPGQGRGAGRTLRPAGNPARGVAPQVLPLPQRSCFPAALAVRIGGTYMTVSRPGGRLQGFRRLRPSTRTLKRRNAKQINAKLSSELNEPNTLRSKQMHRTTKPRNAKKIGLAYPGISLPHVVRAGSLWITRHSTPQTPSVVLYQVRRYEKRSSPPRRRQGACRSKDGAVRNGGCGTATRGLTRRRVLEPLRLSTASRSPEALRTPPSVRCQPSQGRLRPG